MLSQRCSGGGSGCLEAILQVEVVGGPVLSLSCCLRCAWSWTVMDGSCDSNTLTHTVDGGVGHVQGSSDTLDQNAGIHHPDDTISFSIINAWHFDAR